MAKSRSFASLRMTRLRRFDLAQNTLHDLIAGDLFGFGLVGRQHAMPEDVGRDGLDVVRRHERAAAEEGVSPRGLRQRDRRSRAGAEFDERGEILQASTRWLA